MTSVPLITLLVSIESTGLEPRTPEFIVCALGEKLLNSGKRRNEGEEVEH